MTDHLTADAPSSDTPEPISDLSPFTAVMTWGESLDARRKLAIEMSRRALDHLLPDPRRAWDHHRHHLL